MNSNPAAVMAAVRGAWTFNLACCGVADISLILLVIALETSSSLGLLICTLISENPGLQKSRYVSNRRKLSGPANLDFFLGLHLERKLDLYH